MRINTFEWNRMFLRRSNHFISVICLLATPFLATALEVTDVSVVSHRPWNKQVDVWFSITGADSAEHKVELTATYTGCPAGGLHATALAGDPIVKGNGRHRLVWNLDKDAPGLIANDFTVTADVTPYAAGDPVYIVIDLSAGSEAASYPTRYSFAAPNLADDVCRTTELWLKRVPAGIFTMGYLTGNTSCLPEHTVTLTKPFYMAIFEVTQKQWERVMGTWPSFFTNEVYREVRPVESVTFSNIRGGRGGWYGDSGAPTASSFMGKIRAKSGLSGLDLPSEAQWSYTYRAGSTTLFYFGSNDQAQLAGKGRTGGWTGEYQSSDADQDLTKGSAKVGSYPANPWGFYDFIGNVSEIVPDPTDVMNWSTVSASDLLTTDPRCPRAVDSGKTGAGTLCGTGFNTNTGTADHAYWRRAYQLLNGTDEKARYKGFRLCLNLQ